jgi:hypothetical protein
MSHLFLPFNVSPRRRLPVFLRIAAGADDDTARAAIGDNRK